MKEVNRFLNGFNLLLDFEVARRLRRTDCYKDLPIITSISYLLHNFNDLKVVKDCFDKLFSGKEREKFIKSDIIPNQNITTQRQIRDDLKIFHQDTEDSDEEYSQDE